MYVECTVESKGAGGFCGTSVTANMHMHVHICDMHTCTCPTDVSAGLAQVRRLGGDGGRRRQPRCPAFVLASLVPVRAALPFGGYKQSGWGREMGHEVLDLYTETKAVCLGL